MQKKKEKILICWNYVHAPLHIKYFNKNKRAMALMLPTWLKLHIHVLITQYILIDQTIFNCLSYTGHSQSLALLFFISSTTAPHLAIMTPPACLPHSLPPLATQFSKTFVKLLPTSTTKGPKTLLYRTFTEHNIWERHTWQDTVGGRE